MSKTDYTIVEINSNQHGEMTEIAMLVVDVMTHTITATFSTQVLTQKEKDEGCEKKGTLYTLEEVLPIVKHFLNGRKLASYTGLDREGSYLNDLLNEKYGFGETISRKNIIDAHVLVMKFLKGLNPRMEHVANYFGVQVKSGRSPLKRAYATYAILNKLFEDSSIRQHSYKYSSTPISMPEVKTQPRTIVRVVQVTKVVEVEKGKVSTFKSFSNAFRKLFGHK